MGFSKYVVQTTHNNQQVYFNTVTRRHLPIDATIDRFHSKFFLAGQEHDALVWQIMRRPMGKSFFLFVAPTWECNLRCTHCMVKHQLVRSQEKEIDVPAIKDFALRCMARYGTTNFPIQFYGGESLLAVPKCVELMDSISSIEGLETRFSLYTNLAVELTEEHIDFLRKLYSIGVSIDGLEEQHNMQRIPLNGHINPFEVSMSNLRKLVLAGLKDKIEVQACLKDEFNTLENRLAVYEMIVRFGVAYDRINIGTISPTKLHPQPSDMYISGLRQPRLSQRCCCKYRQHIYLTDCSGNIFSDYYTYTPIGTIYDDLETLEKQQAKLTLNTMPVFNDPKCKECPVVGYCWGGCTVVENTGHNLSKYCDQHGLIAHVESLAKEGNLIPQVNKPDERHINI